MKKTTIKIAIAISLIALPLNLAARELNECNELLLNNKYEEAETCYRSASTNYKQHNESLLGVAISLYKIKKYQESIDTLSAINEESYRNVKVPFWKAMSYRMMKEYDKSIRYFTECISYGENEVSIEARKYRGITILSKILLTQYPRLNREGKTYPFSIDEIEDRNKAAEIKEDLKKCANDFSFYSVATNNSDKICFVHALSKYHIGEKEESIHIFESCSKTKENEQRSYYMIGIIHQDYKRQTEAIKSFTSSIKSNPKHSKSFYHRALSYIEMGYKDLATKDLITAIRISPNKLYMDALLKITSKQ